MASKPEPVFSPDVAEKIIRLLTDGVGEKRVARLSGITPAVLRSWRRQGEEDPDGPFGKFAEDCLTAKDKAETRMERTVYVAADRGDVKAAMWWLSKRLPNEYGDKMTLETIEQVDVKQMDEGTRKEVQSVLRKLHALKSKKQEANS